MARLKKIPSTEDALKMELDELMSLSRSDLARIVSRVTDTANKRVNRMVANDIKVSPALRTAQKGGKFSVKGKDIPSLIEELNRARGFLTAQTGSVKGAKSTMQKTRDTLKQRYGIDTSGLSDNDLADIFDRIDKMSLEDEIKQIACSTLMTQAVELTKENKGNIDSQLSGIIKKVREEQQERPENLSPLSRMKQAQKDAFEIENDETEDLPFFS